MLLIFFFLHICLYMEKKRDHYINCHTSDNFSVQTESLLREILL